MDTNEDGCPHCGGELDYKVQLVEASLYGEPMTPRRMMLPYCTECGAHPSSVIVNDLLDRLERPN